AMAAEEEEAAVPPQKRFYRQRAHANPLADHTLRYPPRPQDMDWASLFPAFFPPDAPPGTHPARVEFADWGADPLIPAIAPLVSQLSKLFFLFPDPHFKRTKHKWRIISPAMLAEYGYVLRPGGLVYTVTDVPELHQWMLQHFGEHPLFEPLPPAQLAADPLVPLLPAVTEEGQRAQRAGRPP
ncbi:TRMB methyltransferase, partial [Menura novaehollandiae]|nr:TRMB methyltransferase [Menura novaehollandiae]